MTAEAGVTINFVEKANGPERLVCEVELVFSEGLLAGMKLTGFTLWRSAKGDVYVTFPSRAFGTAADRKFFDYLRPVAAGTEAAVRRVKDAIVEAYREARQ